jgi:hypothetical protein
LACLFAYALNAVHQKNAKALVNAPVLTAATQSKQAGKVWGCTSSGNGYARISDVFSLKN